MDWGEHVDQELEHRLIGWRRHLHENPELSFEEHETTEFIAGLLEQWGVEYERPLPTGVVAHSRGEQPGPTIALRCDIDALPIDEQNAFDFKSRVPGKMHACGHDGHTAVLLGVARTLAGIREQLRGEVRLLFQPAEEVVESGARSLIATGAVNGADAVVGLHLLSDVPLGKMVVHGGPLMAAADFFTITVRGSGGHGAYPHQTTDALVIGAGLVGELQRLVSRRVDPLQPAVVTVGSFHSGAAGNVIPGEAVLTGTVRTFDSGVRDLIESEMERLVSTYTAASGATGELNYQRGNPPVLNHDRLAEVLVPAAEAAVGAGNVIDFPLVMGGEDFAYYSGVAPSVFAFVGARSPEAESTFPHHHPRFTIDERSLTTGVRFFLETLERTSSAAGTLPPLS